MPASFSVAPSLAQRGVLVNTCAPSCRGRLGKRLARADARWSDPTAAALPPVAGPPKICDPGGFCIFYHNRYILPCIAIYHCPFLCTSLYYYIVQYVSLYIAMVLLLLHFSSPLQIPRKLPQSSGNG